MKLNNKILYLTAAGVISTLTPANTNAQTFYQCMPITCSDGQYINGNKCENCPAGTFQKGNNRATSCTPCSAGYYSDAGKSSCTICPAGSYCTGGKLYYCPANTYVTTLGSTSSANCKACASSTTIRVDQYRRAISDSALANGGGCSLYVAENTDLKLSLGDNSFEDIHKNNTFKFSSSLSQRADRSIGSFTAPYKYNFLNLTINGSQYVDVTTVVYSCYSSTGNPKITLYRKGNTSVTVK